MSRQGSRPANGTHSLQFGSEKVDFCVSFGYRKSLRITVYPDLRIIVDAPVERSLDEIIPRLKKRASWIIKQRDFFEKFMPRMPEKRYVSGETFYYLGRQYRLKIVNGKRKSVKLNGRFLYLHTPEKQDKHALKTLVQGWYRRHARTIFQKRLETCQKTASKGRKVNIRLREMTRRWGSYNGANSILLNTALVKAPVHCIDYVITHELCHLQQPRHGSSFFRLLERLMPDWKQRKDRLERVALE